MDAATTYDDFFAQYDFAPGAVQLDRGLDHTYRPS